MVFFIKKNFSQFNEDIFIIKNFKNKKNSKFVDLEAFHPIRFNNTYLLYKKSWSGINVDLNQTSIDMFNIIRKKDKKLLKKTKIMKAKNFSSLIKKKIDFLNIDLEGHNYEVLKTINLKRYQPSLLCIEILNKKNIFRYFKNNNYNFLLKKKVSYFFEKNL